MPDSSGNSRITNALRDSKNCAELIDCLLRIAGSHPNEPFHLEIMRDICERFIFARSGRLTHATDFESLIEHEPVQDYLGELLH